MNMELEAARKRAVELGNTGKNHDWEELTVLLKSGYPAVRRAAASGLGKMIDRSPDLARLLTPNLSFALKDEPAPQVLQYILKTLLKCAPFLNALALDDLGDIVRDPARTDYVRDAANNVIAAVRPSAARETASPFPVLRSLFPSSPPVPILFITILATSWEGVGFFLTTCR